MRATEFKARMYEPGSPHPRLVKVSLDGDTLVVRYDEGGEVVLPFEELEIRPGPLSQERVVLASQTTRQSLVADDRKLLDHISRGGAPPHLKKQISKSHFDRRVGFVKKSLGRLVLLVLLLLFLGFLFIGFLAWVYDDDKKSTSTTEETQEESREPAVSVPPVVPGAPGMPATSKQTEFPGADAYMRTVQTKIKQNWHPPKSARSKRVSVVFAVKRDGSLREVKIEKSSGVRVADQEAINAVKRSAPFPPLPSSLPEPVDIQFTFDYNVFQH